MSLSIRVGGCQPLIGLRDRTFWGGCRRVGGCRSGSRPFSSSHDGVQTFEVACGSSGHLTVDIHNPSALLSPQTPLTIYLPQTGVHLRSSHPAIPNFLLTNPVNQLPSPVARINYRWNHVPPPSSSSPSSSSSSYPQEKESRLLSSHRDFANHPFPTPLHDMMHAFSWLTEIYLPSCKPKELESRSPYAAVPYVKRQPPRPLLIYGSFLGGTLATTLALTESHASKSALFPIRGLIVHNGVFDWSGVATTRDPLLPSSSSQSPTPSSQFPNNSDNEISVESGEGFEPLPPKLALLNDWPQKAWTLQTLHALKTTLFSRPSSCFDTFASPALFFRSPALAYPLAPPYFPGCKPPPLSSPTPDLAGLNISDAERDDMLAMLGVESDPDDGSESTITGGKKDKVKEIEPEPQRRAHLIFPPNKSGLKIPKSLFLYTLPSLSSVPSSVSPKSTAKASNASKQASKQASKSKTKSRVKHKMKGGQIGEDEAEVQAEDMVRLMRRSIVTYEYKDRVVWDEDADPQWESEGRVQLHAIQDDVQREGKGEIELELEGVVRGWMEELD